MSNGSFRQSIEDYVCLTGISGAFPESDSVKELAENLFHKVDLVTEDDRRWKHTRTDIPHRTGKINGLNKFDSEAFGIGYKLAHTMDPMQRMLLEKTHECIIDAGMNPEDLRNTKTGVFLSCFLSESEPRLVFAEMQNNEHGLTGCQRFMLAHRISEWLQLKGPSYNTDTACSSSLFALEQAYTSIREGACDAAIVGGSNLCLHQNTSMVFARLGILSYDGRCKSLDDRANGYARSENVACCLLQKAKDSRRVYARIVYAKTNCDGFKSQGIHYPAGRMQRRLIEDFYNICGVDPSTVEFVEAHATGTRVGDVEEANAIAEIFCKSRTCPLLIGSVKSNLGHGEACSVLNSIAKAIIAYNTGYIPPNINYKVPRKEIHALHNGQFKVVTEKTPWSRGYLAISSFGFGGANAHVLLENVSKPKHNNGLPSDKLPRLVCISSRTQAGVDKAFDDLESRTVDKDEIRLWHAIFQKPIKQNSYRGYLLLGSTPESSVRLARVTRHRSSSDVISNTDVIVCFKYSSLRSHWTTIAAQLMHIPVFASSIRKFSSNLENNGLNLLTAVEDLSTKDKQFVIGNIAVLLALTDVLKSVGIKPNYINGEDIGGYADDSLTIEQMIFKVLMMSRAGEQPLNGITAADIQQCATSLSQCPGAVVVHIGLQEDSAGTGIPLVNQNTDCVEYLFTALGKLYLEGLDLNLAELYPAVSFPVAQGTPMLSHLVEWDHTDNWFVMDCNTDPYLQKSFIGETNLQIELEEEDDEFLKGHVIDGRLIYPGTGYLVRVWDTFAATKKQDLADISVVFEDIYLLRTTTFPKNGCVELNITLQRETGKFEISQDRIKVMTGRIYEAKNVGKDFRAIPDAKTKNKTKYDHVLNSKDFYKELNIRGYQYRGLFRSVRSSNVYGTEGGIFWKENWVAFLDNMLQVQIIGNDSRSLYVPTRIDRVAIDVELHREVLEHHTQSLDLDVVVPFKVYPHAGVVRAGGVEIRGLHTTAISKRPPLSIPVLEKNVFVPHFVESIQIQDAIRTDMQIILENIQLFKCKIIELADDILYNNSLQPIIDVVGTILADVPRVQPELLLLTDSKKFASESNAILFIGACLLGRPDILEAGTKTLKSKCFILSRESTRPTPSDCPDGYNIINVLGNESEYLVMLRKKVKRDTVKYIEVTTSDNTFCWIEKVKAEIKIGSNIGLYSQNEPINGLLGLVNCLRKEVSGENITGILISDPSAPKFNPALEFYKSQLDLGLGINVYKNGQWGTYRHLLIGDVQDVPVTHAYVKPTVYGDLSSLHFHEGPLCDLQHDKIVHVYCSALNFRDVMTATGRIKADSVVEGRINQECVQGIEMAGKLNDGTRVMATGDRCITNLAPFKEVSSWRIPDGWTFAEAATVPIAYTTAFQAMVLIGRIKKGESILIHAGSGAVGQAAINVALAYGLEVFTTVGTPDKRAFIKRLYPHFDDDHIGNSRDISFEHLIRRVTKGAGVDLVLNSLSDEKLQASAKCLKPGGRFLEIGKYDISSNTQIKTCFLNKGVSFHAIYLDYSDRSSGMREKLAQLIREGIKSGVVRPITYCTFDVNEVEQAFRYIAAAKHIGKVVIKIRDEEPVSSAPTRPTYFPIKAIPRYNCNEEYVYVLVGGLGGFGLELADWLVMRGGRKLVFSSRSGVSNGYQALRLKFWQEYGAEVEVCTADVSTERGCGELLRAAGERGLVAAIFNLAVVLNDAMFDNQTADTFATSFLPKAQATIHLDKLSRKLCPALKDFVVFSSVSCGRGNAGQTNYGFSNSVMERICEQRRQDGFPALAIQWGAIGDVGLLADMQDDNIPLEIGGTLPQKISSCLECLDVFLKQKEVVVSSIVVAEKRSAGCDSNNVVEVISNILGITNLKAISKQVPLSEYGMDSVMAVQIKQTLERDFEIFLNAQEIRMLTFTKLSEFATQNAQVSEQGSENISDNKDNVDSVNIIYKSLGDESMANEEYLCLPSLASTSDETTTFEDEILFLLPGIESCAEVLKVFCSKLNMKTIVMQLGTTTMDLEAMVARLYKVVKEKLIPSGTFHLLGYSFGVLPILQLAAKLEDEGYRGIVICVDGSPMFFKELFKESVDLDNQKQLENYILLHMFNNLSASVPGLTKMLEDTDTIEEKAARFFNLLPFKLNYSLGFLHSMALAIVNRTKVILEYNKSNNFKKISSRIVLIRQKAMSAAITCNECYDLNEFTDEAVSVHCLNYGHKEIIDSVECANIVNESLEQLDVVKQKGTNPHLMSNGVMYTGRLKNRSSIL